MIRKAFIGIFILAVSLCEAFAQTVISKNGPGIALAINSVTGETAMTKAQLRSAELSFICNDGSAELKPAGFTVKIPGHPAKVFAGNAFEPASELIAGVRTGDYVVLYHPTMADGKSVRSSLEIKIID